MSRIFLDVGASNGSSISFFRENHPDADKFNIFSFESLPSNIEQLKLIRPKVEIIPCAAWSSNGTVRMYIGKPKSGTMYADKTTGNVDANNHIEVPCIDLAEFIRYSCRPSDEIWLKMNVEGAEYELVPHLYKNGLIPWFDRMYIRWHNGKVPSLQCVHDEVLAMVPNARNVWRKKEMLPLV